MNDTKKEELKVLIENDGFITLDQILTILESIDFMYRVLYRYELKLPYNYRLAEDKKLRLSQLSSEKSFEFLFQSDVYSSLQIFGILFGIMELLRKIAVLRKTWQEGTATKWKGKNEKLVFEEKVKEIAREEKDLATFPEDELQRLLSSLLTIFYILESSNINIFKINDVEMFTKVDDHTVIANQPDAK